MTIGANQDDWKTQTDLLIKFNNIQLRALTILLQAEIECREDMVWREKSLKSLTEVKNRFTEL